MKTTIIKTISIAALVASLLALTACSNMLTDLEETDESGISIEGPVYENPTLTTRHTYDSNAYDSDAFGYASFEEIQTFVPASTTDFTSKTTLDKQDLPAEGELYKLNMTFRSLAADEIIYTADFLANQASFGDQITSIKAIYDLSDVPVDKPETSINFLVVADGYAQFKGMSTDSNNNVVAEAVWVYADGEAVIGGPDYTQEVGGGFSYPTTTGAEVSVHVKLEEGWNRLVYEYTWNDAGDTVEAASVTIDSQRDISWMYYDP